MNLRSQSKLVFVASVFMALRELKYHEYRESLYVIWRV